MGARLLPLLLPKTHRGNTTGSHLTTSTFPHPPELGGLWGRGKGRQRHCSFCPCPTPTVMLLSFSPFPSNPAPGEETGGTTALEVGEQSEWHQALSPHSTPSRKTSGSNSCFPAHLLFSHIQGCIMTLVGPRHFCIRGSLPA